MGYVGSYVWELRQELGSRLLLLPGAQVLVTRTDGLVLFQRRSDNGVWEFPAGSCEPGQGFVDAAVAELFEETGIRAQPFDLIPFASLSDPGLHTLHYPNGDLVHAFALCFLLPDWEGSVIPEEAEVTEIDFFDIDHPPQPLHGPTVEVIRLFKEYRRSGAFQAG